MRGNEQCEEQMDFLMKVVEDARKAAYKRAPENRRESAIDSRDIQTVSVTGDREFQLFIIIP